MSDRYAEYQNPISVGNSLQRAWDALKPNIWSFVGFTLLFYFALGVLQFMLGFIPFAGQLTSFLGFIYPVSMYSAFQVADGGAEVRFQDFLNWQPRFGRLLLGSAIVYGILLAVAIPLALVFGFSLVAASSYAWAQLTGLGFGVLSLGSLFMIAYGILTFAYHFLLLKRDAPLGETLALSARTGLKHFGTIILFGLLMLGLFLLGFIACGVGLLVTFPLIFGVQYFLLLSIFPEENRDRWDFDSPSASGPYQL